MDKKILEKLVKENKSLHKIAAELNCSKTNVEYWLKKLGLSTNLKRYNKGSHKNTPPRCTTCGEIDATKFLEKRKTYVKNVKPRITQKLVVKRK